MRNPVRQAFTAVVFIVFAAVGLTEARADYTARSDTARGVRWNTLNKNGKEGQYRKDFHKDPAGSTYVLQVFVEAPASGPSIPPASPFPIPDGATSDPQTAPMRWQKFFEEKGKLSSSRTWDPLTDRVDAAGGAFALGKSSGESRRYDLIAGPDWSAFPHTETEAKASMEVPRATAWAKVYDPWDFHDYVFSGVDSYPLDTLLAESAALTIQPNFDVNADLETEFATATSETSLDIEGEEMFHMFLTLSETGGRRSFNSDIFFHPEAELFSFSIDDDDELILGSMLSAIDFITGVNSAYDPQTGIWSPPANGFQVLIARRLSFPPAFYTEGGGHVSAAFNGSDRVFVAPVPEPSTFQLFGVAFLAFGSIRLRRRSRRLHSAHLAKSQHP